MESTLANADDYATQLWKDLRFQRLTILDGRFIRELANGTVSREQIGRWARFYYALTKNGRLTIANLYAHSPDDDALRKELAANLYEEETGRLSKVNKCHMDVFFDFLAAFDVTPDEARALARPAAATLTAGGPAAPIPSDGYYTYLSVYGLLGEAPNAEFCEIAYTAMSKHYGFTDQELTWFYMHARLDKDHGAMLGTFFEKAAAEHGGLDGIRSAAFTLAPLYQNIWNTFGAWR